MIHLRKIARQSGQRSPGRGHARLPVGDYARLLRFLESRLSNEQDARDLAQEAYLRLLRASSEKLIQDPVAYLFRIARNLLYEWYTSLPPPAESLDRAEIAGEKASAEDRLEMALHMDKLERALRRLSPKRRAVVLMHRRDGMTYGEIAEQLGISSSMVKKHLSLGLVECRNSLRALREN